MDHKEVYILKLCNRKKKSLAYRLERYLYIARLGLGNRLKNKVNHLSIIGV